MAAGCWLMAAGKRTDQGFMKQCCQRTKDAAFVVQRRTMRCMPDYKKLRVWGKAYALAINADRVANEIRDLDHRPLRSQMNRAAMSIPANIVEGRAKSSD